MEPSSSSSSFPIDTVMEVLSHESRPSQSNPPDSSEFASTEPYLAPESFAPIDSYDISESMLSNPSSVDSNVHLDHSNTPVDTNRSSHASILAIPVYIEHVLDAMPPERTMVSLYYLMEHFGACSSSTYAKTSHTEINSDIVGEDFRPASSRANGRMQLLYLFILGLANTADASEIIAIGFILDLFKKEVPMSSFEEGLIAAAVFAGMLLGGTIAGVLGDRLGRRGVLVLAIIFNAFAGITSAFSSSAWILVSCRFLGGLGIGGSMPPVFALAAELSLPSRQGRAVSWIAWNWVFGSVYVAGSAWVTLGILETSWRVFAILAALPAVLCAVLSILFVPESPPLLLSMGKDQEALEIIATMAARNGVLFDVPLNERKRVAREVVRRVLLKWERSNLESSLRTSRANYAEGTIQEEHVDDNQGYESDSSLNNHTHKEFYDTTEAPEHPSVSVQRKSLMGPRDSNSTNYSTEEQTTKSISVWSQITHLYRSRSTRGTLLLLQLTWFMLSLGTYGLAVWVPRLFEKVGFETGKYVESFMYTSAQAPSCIISSLTVDSPAVGPKRLLVYCAVLASFCTGAFVVFDLSAFYAVTLVCLYQLFTTACWNALDVLATASFPAKRRTTAFAMQSACGRAGAIAGQFIFSYLVEKNPELALGCCAIVVLTSAVATLSVQPFDERVSIVLDENLDITGLDETHCSPSAYDATIDTKSKNSGIEKHHKISNK